MTFTQAKPVTAFEHDGCLYKDRKSAIDVQVRQKISELLERQVCYVTAGGQQISREIGADTILEKRAELILLLQEYDRELAEAQR